MEEFYQPWTDEQIEDAIGHLRDVKVEKGYKILEMGVKHFRDQTLMAIPFVADTDQLRIQQGVAQSVIWFLDLPKTLANEMEEFLSLRRAEEQVMKRPTKRLGANGL